VKNLTLKSMLCGDARSMMRKPRLLRAVVLLLPCLAFNVWAEDTLTLINAGANYVMGGVYTSPYGISINGGSPVSLICDDFTTDISLNESWSAIPTTFADLQAGTNPGGTPKFTPVDIQNYAVTAVLAAELMALPNLASEPAGEISYALWDVFDPTLLTSTNTGYGTLTTAELTAAQGYLSSAQALVAGATTGGVVNLNQISIGGHAIEGLTIYTPDPKSAAQEFLSVQVDEPPYPAVLAMDLVGMAGLIVVFRRRLTGVLS
jgi:hypothetical protein